MKPTRVCLLVCALAWSPLPAPTQTAAAGQVDGYVKAEMARQRIPGLALGVYREGRIVNAQGYGLANVELNVPVRPESIFQSGSVGKQFTATAVMMLVEDGKVGLEDSITKYFPEAPANWQPITVRNLLTHTSGLAEYESNELTFKPGSPFYLRLDFTEDELFTRVAALPLDFQPGEKWSYRNTNYLVLGFLIRKVTGEFYGDFLKERIFKPLGMNNTRIISDAAIIPNRAAGYQLVKGELKNQDWVSPTFNSTADGTLYFNVLDLAKWDGGLYTEKLLKRSSFEQMWTIAKLSDGQPNPANYGFAWEINEVNRHRVIEHSGSWQGFTMQIARYVDDRLTVVVLTNLSAAGVSPGKIAHHVAGLYVPALRRPEMKPIEDKEPGVTAFFRSLLDKIAAGNADPADFAPSYRGELFPNDIKDYAIYFKDLGELKSVELLDRKEENGLRRYTYRATFSEGALVLRLALDRGNKLAELHDMTE